MSNRRMFVIGAAAVMVTRPATAAPESHGRLQAWAMRTAPLPGFPPNYPADHTAVVGLKTAKQWRCFGRTAAEGGDENRMISEADGDELWAAEIAGAEGTSGLEINVTGACQQCSNRILLPAGIDVDKARGSEIATPLFGKYGFGIPALIVRIKDGALAINKAHPRRISEQRIQAAVGRVKVNNTEEWSVVEKYLETIFRPQLGNAWPACKADLSRVYLSLYNYREVLFSQYSKGRITKVDFVGRLQVALTGTIQLVSEIVTPVKVATVSTIPPSDLAALVLNNR